MNLQNIHSKFTKTSIKTTKMEAIKKFFSGKQEQAPLISQAPHREPVTLRLKIRTLEGEKVVLQTFKYGISGIEITTEILKPFFEKDKNTYGLWRVYFINENDEEVICLFKYFTKSHGPKEFLIIQDDRIGKIPAKKDNNNTENGLVFDQTSNEDKRDKHFDLLLLTIRLEKNILEKRYHLWSIVDEISGFQIIQLFRSYYKDTEGQKFEIYCLENGAKVDVSQMLFTKGQVNILSSSTQPIIIEEIIETIEQLGEESNDEKPEEFAEKAEENC